MKLENKKALVARTLNVGKGRISFNRERLPEVKEAITKQDIRDLKESGAIIINDIKGARTKVKRKTRRRAGSIKKKPKYSKRKYIILVRKLRAYVFELRKQNKVSFEEYIKLRNAIRQRRFRSKAHLKEIIHEFVSDKKETK